MAGDSGYTRCAYDRGTDVTDNLLGSREGTRAVRVKAHLNRGEPFLFSKSREK